LMATPYQSAAVPQPAFPVMEVDPTTGEWISGPFRVDHTNGNIILPSGGELYLDGTSKSAGIRWDSGVSGVIIDTPGNAFIPLDVLNHLFVGDLGLQNTLAISSSGMWRVSWGTVAGTIQLWADDIDFYLGGSSSPTHIELYRDHFNMPRESANPTAGLQDGSIYYNTSTKRLRVYDHSAGVWREVDYNPTLGDFEVSGDLNVQGSLGIDGPISNLTTGYVEIYDGLNITGDLLVDMITSRTGTAYLTLKGRSGYGIKVIDGAGGDIAVFSNDDKSLDMVGGAGSWFAPPRMTTAERDTMTSGWGAGEVGRIWYNTDTNQWEGWDGSAVVIIG